MNDPAVQKAYLGGATAGGHTASAPVITPAAPQSRPAAPAPARSAPPRPAAQNPSDIAAAAMQSVSLPTPRPAAPPQNAAQAQPSPAPAPGPVPAAPKPAAASDGVSHSAGSAQNIDIDDLVSRARSTSAGRVSSRSNGTSRPPASIPPLNGAARTSGSAAASLPSSPQLKMPDLTDSRDRLQSVLNEIEEAAARARAYRPNSDR